MEQPFTKAEYSDLVDKKSPNSPIMRNIICAFIVGIQIGKNTVRNALHGDVTPKIHLYVFVVIGITGFLVSVMSSCAVCAPVFCAGGVIGGTVCDPVLDAVSCQKILNTDGSAALTSAVKGIYFISGPHHICFVAAGMERPCTNRKRGFFTIICLDDINGRHFIVNGGVFAHIFGTNPKNAHVVLNKVIHTVQCTTGRGTEDVKLILKQTNGEPVITEAYIFCKVAEVTEPRKVFGEQFFQLGSIVCA